MVAGLAVVDQGVISSLRLGLGAVADRPVRARAAEGAALGKRVSAATIAEVRAALSGEIRPIDDVRSTAAYRLRVTGNLVADFLGSLG
jgi:CO/xanthine dehydrogenase FAD-binding subunit